MKREVTVLGKFRIGMTSVPLILFLGIFALGASAQDIDAETWPQIETGRLLYLSCAIRAEAWLDGVPVGGTPLLMELKTGEHRLEVSTRDGVFRRRIVSRSALSELSRLEAVLEPYRGNLRLICDTGGALLSVDGSSPTPIPAGALSLKEGDHQVQVTAPGRITFISQVRIPRDGSVDLRIELAKGFPLRFAKSPPKGSLLALLDADGKAMRTIDPWSAELLPEGMAKFRLILPSGYDAEFSWDPGTAEAADPSYSGRLLLENLPAGASVEIDGIPADSFAVHLLAPGFHGLRIRKSGYMTIVLLCEIKPGKDTKPWLVFVEDRAFIQAKKNALGLPIAISGGVLAAGGFVLNMDSSAVALSSDYESYKLLKYLGLGAFGVGLAALASGVGVIVIRF